MERVLIAAKRESVELQYRKESARLSSTHRAEVARREEVKRAEALVWSEIARLASGSGVFGNIERSLRAHRSLDEAQQLHAQALVMVRQQGRATQQAEAVRDQVAAMLATSRRKEASAVESRQCEDSLEIAIAEAAMRDRIRAADSSEVCGLAYQSDLGSRDPAPRVPPAATATSASIGAGCDVPTTMAAGAAAPLTVRASLLESAEGAATLKVLCSHPTGGRAVGLTLQRVGSEGLLVVMRAALPELVATLLRERGALTRELTQAGLRVQSVAVEVGAVDNSNMGGDCLVARRRGRQRRDDEALVA
jgi:hypothetical protein